ncbi:MAG: hypothetical protein K0R41_1687 [Geminicoccaceae bacterium]|nr:hypothetical protein [Geminicoccaceae bacterium]
MRDRVDRAALVDVPGLGALDVHRVDVVGVEMGGEARPAARGEIEVALHLAAERLLEGVRERGEPGAQMVDVVGDQGRTLLQEALDLVRIGPQHLAAAEAGGRGAVARGRDQLVLEHQLERGLRPDRRHAEQVVEPVPAHDRGELVGSTLEVQRSPAFVLGEEALGAERRQDLVEAERRRQHAARVPPRGASRPSTIEPGQVEPGSGVG